MDIETLLKAIMDAKPSVRHKVEGVLKGISSTPQSNAKRDCRLASISGTAKLLAVSRNSVYSLIRQKRLDVVMLTGSPRVTLQSIYEFLDGQRPENATTTEMISESQARYQASKAKGGK